MRSSTTDAIIQEIIVEANPERVWRAVSDAAEFGEWFGMRCDRPFAPGAEIGCEITIPEEYRGTRFPIWIERMEAPRLFSFRWHPYPIEGGDLAAEPTTLVTFTLEEAEGGTRVTIVESGFDDIPLERRAEAFGSNAEGWRIQAQNLAAHVTRG